MSYTQVFLHYVWATHRRRHTLVKPHRELLFDHIRQNALLKGIYLDRINGYSDHVHCLVWLKPQQSIDKVAQMLKGESAYWFNNLSGIKSEKLKWQENYFAISVSLNMIDRVRAYIDHQETHHQKRTFGEEYEELLKKYHFIHTLDNSPTRYKLNTGR